jgi:hypothetical protein
MPGFRFCLKTTVARQRLDVIDGEYPDRLTSRSSDPSSSRRSTSRQPPGWPFWNFAFSSGKTIVLSSGVSHFGDVGRVVQFRDFDQAAVHEIQQARCVVCADRESRFSATTSTRSRGCLWKTAAARLFRRRNRKSNETETVIGKIAFKTPTTTGA